MTVFEQYLAEAKGNKTSASAQLCLDLMRGDVNTLKQGYSIGNALFVAIEHYNLTAREVALVAESIVRQRKEATIGQTTRPR